MTLTATPAPDATTEVATRYHCEGDLMLIHEALARSRQREAEQRALRYRRARRVTAGRGWARVAAWAERRAAAERTRAGG